VFELPYTVTHRDKGFDIEFYLGDAKRKGTATGAALEKITAGVASGATKVDADTPYLQTTWRLKISKGKQKRQAEETALSRKLNGIVKSLYKSFTTSSLGKSGVTLKPTLMYTQE
jgi:hypothetical protein